MCDSPDTNKQLQEILDILKRQNVVLDEHSKELKEIRERISELEQGQKTLSLNQDVMRAYYHEINIKMGRFDEFMSRMDLLSPCDHRDPTGAPLAMSAEGTCVLCHDRSNK